jgi:hypothetical protein
VAPGSVTILDQLGRKEEGMVNGRLWNTYRGRLASPPGAYAVTLLLD